MQIVLSFNTGHPRKDFDGFFTVLPVKLCQKLVTNLQVIYIGFSSKIALLNPDSLVASSMAD